eukprot:m.125397 g.125397  ORF g.125397 m.125397 type:complete len:531 (+) comp37873_c0_seq7:323-1915(+)
MVDHAYSSVRAVVRDGDEAIPGVRKNCLVQSLDSASLRRELAATTTQHGNDDEDVVDTGSDRLTTSCFADLKMEMLAECSADACEELTSLSWLQNTNLLKDLQAKTKVKIDDVDSKCSFIEPSGPSAASTGRNPTPIRPVAMNTTTSASSSASAVTGRRSTTGKPPYSFACLIFMAIEDAPTKRLAVKDIYQWIQDNFTYFKTAPAGWKNSVRHNLSLNKSFKRTDKQRGQVGKGSLWTVDVDSRAMLIQGLRKTHHQPFEQFIRSSSGSKRPARMSESSDGGSSSLDSDFGDNRKKVKAQLSLEEATAAEIMCSFGAPTKFSDSATSRRAELLTPKPKHGLSVSRSPSQRLLRGKRGLNSAGSTAFQSSTSPVQDGGKTNGNMFSGLETMATVASLARDIEEELSRHNSSRSSPIMTRRSKAASQSAASRLLQEALTKRLAAKTSYVDSKRDLRNGDREGKDEEDEEEEEVAAAMKTDTLNDSGFGDGRRSGSNSSPESALATADIFLEADKILSTKKNWVCQEAVPTS